MKMCIYRRRDMKPGKYLKIEPRFLKSHLIIIVLKLSYQEVTA